MEHRSDRKRINLNYQEFFEDTKKEGLKGRFKLFIFKFIGFFAFWQEQINRSLYQDVTDLRSEVEKNHRTVDDLNRQLAVLSRTEDALRQDVTDLRSEVEKNHRTVDDLNRQLAVLSRTEDALYQDVTNLRAGVAEKDKLEKLVRELNKQQISLSRKCDLLDCELKKDTGFGVNQTIGKNSK